LLLFSSPLSVSNPNSSFCLIHSSLTLLFCSKLNQAYRTKTKRNKLTPTPKSNPLTLTPLLILRHSHSPSLATSVARSYSPSHCYSSNSPEFQNIFPSIVNSEMGLFPNSHF
ncbi:hypothetical protein TorRG33x02_270380, partial [Trema orientale]